MAGNNVVQITGVLSPTIRDNYHNCYNTPVHVFPRSSFEAVNKFNGNIRLFNYDRDGRGSSTKISRKAVPNDQFSGGTTLLLEYYASLDCVLISTDHSLFNWDEIVEHATLVVDTRNATKNVTNGREKIFKA